MNTNKHPMASVAFMTRPIPRGTASTEGNFPPPAKARITTVRTSGTVFEKAAGRDADWVQVS